MISEEWRYFLKIHTKSDSDSIDSQKIEKCRSVYPGEMVNFLRDFGFGNYGNGLIKIVDVDFLSPVVSIIFDEDQDFRQENVFVYAFSAFGRLYCFDRGRGIFVVDLLSYEVILSPGFDDLSDSDLDAKFPESLFVAKPDLIDPKSADGRTLLYPRAVKALGVPGPDECFGFVPALPLGGARRVSGLKRLKAVEHFSFLAQLQPFTVMDYSDFPPKPVRQIG